MSEVGIPKEYKKQIQKYVNKFKPLNSRGLIFALTFFDF